MHGPTSPGKSIIECEHAQKAEVACSKLVGQRSRTPATQPLPVFVDQECEIVAGSDWIEPVEERSSPQLFREAPLYEVAFNVSQLSGKELAIASYIFLAGPPRPAW